MSASDYLKYHASGPIEILIVKSIREFILLLTTMPVIQNTASNGIKNSSIPTSCPSCPIPLKYSGSLDHLDYFEITPIIGREYPAVKLIDILNAPNAEDQIRDLAIVISERGVVFFRDQDDLNIVDQKKLCDLLGKLSGRPEDHGLHVHPIYRDPGNLTLPDGTTDVSGSVSPDKGR